CAALVSRMLGLDAGTAREAMGIAEYHSPRSQMMRCIDHPTMVKDSSGWGAMTGISSAYLAQSGFTGAPSLIIDSAECEPYFHDIGQEWLILEQYFKPYPVCRWAQAAIAAAQFLQSTHDFTPDMIEAIEIITFHEGCRLNHPRPTTTEQAQYSLPFPVAAILAKGHCGASEVTTGLEDPDILHLADRITISEDDDYNTRFPAERLARAVIELKDGRRLESPTTQAEGDPETPLSPDIFHQKFLDLAIPMLGDGKAAKVWNMAGSLPEAESLQPFLDTVLAAPGIAEHLLRTTNSAA
ncbi:MAG: MmgE/PrpD family protein, partial [Rhodospirillales bacterium]|nr:MmgE/PrpD family protein [Rhodospirillales bacterium]